MPPELSKTDDLSAWTQKVLPTRLEAIRESGQEILARMQKAGYRDDERFAVHLALEESLVNAMKHGNLMDPSRSVQLSYRISPSRVEIRVLDEGDGFDPCTIPDPTCESNIFKPCGRGIMLMRSYMDEVEFSKSGKEVRMVKHHRPQR